MRRSAHFKFLFELSMTNRHYLGYSKFPTLPFSHVRYDNKQIHSNFESIKEINFLLIESETFNFPFEANFSRAVLMPKPLKHNFSYDLRPIQCQLVTLIEQV